MRSNSSNFPAETKRLEILADMIRLRQDGHFNALWATDRLKIQWEPHGPIYSLSWRKAAEMVATAREAAALAAAPGPETIRKGPGREGLKRAAAAQSGKTR